MVRKIIACFLLSAPLIGQAQKKDKVLEKVAAGISADDMKKHLYIIASKEMEGRDTPSPGLEKAANYIEEQFKSLGLLPGNKDSYRQHYPLYRDSTLNSSVKVNGNSFEVLKDFQPANSNYTAAMRFSETVFAGYGISDEQRDDYKNLDVAGKLVLILDGTPTDYKAPAAVRGQMSPASSTGKIAAASKRGAAAVLVVYNNFPRRAASQNSNWSMRGGYPAKQTPTTFNISTAVAASIMGEDGKGIFDKAKAGIVVTKAYPAQVDLSYAKSSSVIYVSNVMGLLEGTDKKDEYVVLSSHYDHVGKRGDSVIYYGADDDGSGTTGILELAQAFVDAKKQAKALAEVFYF